MYLIKWVRQTCNETTLLVSSFELPTVSCLLQGSLLEGEFHGTGIIFIYGLVSSKHFVSVQRLVIKIGQCAYNNSVARFASSILVFNVSLIFWRSPFNSRYGLIHQFFNFILEYWFSNSSFELKFENQVWKPYLKVRYLPGHEEWKKECIIWISL